MKHYELGISQFVDNELPADEQKKLFAHLTDCEECRRTLSDFMEMKKESKLFYENIDVELNPAIKMPAEVELKKGRNIYKSLFYFSAAASIILGLLFLMKQSGISKLESSYSSLKVKYNELITAHSNVQKNDIITKIKSENVSSIEKRIPEKKVSSSKKHSGLKQNKEQSEHELVEDNSVNEIAENVNLNRQNDARFVKSMYALNEHAVNVAVKNVLDSLRSPNFYSRDLLYRYTPYVRNGKILIDTSFVRDLFLRKNKDKFYFEQPSGKRVQNLAFNRKVKNSSPENLKGEDILLQRKPQQIPVVQVTKNDFLTPQIIGN